MSQKKIVLGVFCEELWDLEILLNAKAYSSCWVEMGVLTRSEYTDIETPIIKTIEFAIDRADEVYFCLNRVFLPFMPHSITCKELNLILNDEVYFEKTNFYVNGIKVSNETVKEAVKQYKNSDIKYEFKDIIQ